MDQLFDVKCGGEKIILLPKPNITIEIPTTQTDIITIRPTEVGIIAKKKELGDEKNVYEIIEQACQEEGKPSWPEGTLAKPVMEYKAIDMQYFYRIPLPPHCTARAQENKQLFVGAAPKYTPINRAENVLNIMKINNEQDLKQITSKELMTWVCEFAVDILAGMKPWKWQDTFTTTSNWQTRVRPTRQEIQVLILETLSNSKILIRVNLLAKFLHIQISTKRTKNYCSLHESNYSSISRFHEGNT